MYIRNKECPALHFSTVMHLSRYGSIDAYFSCLCLSRDATFSPPCRAEDMTQKKHTDGLEWHQLLQQAYASEDVFSVCRAGRRVPVACPACCSSTRPCPLWSCAFDGSAGDARPASSPSRTACGAWLLPPRPTQERIVEVVCD